MITQCCINCGKRVEWVVLWVNVSLLVVKIWFTIATGSKSLLVDSFESAGNCAITIVVLISLILSTRQPDSKYPYGYGKVEYFASGMAHGALMVAAVCLAINSLYEIFIIGEEKPIGFFVTVGATVSVLGNYVIYKYGQCAGTKLNSAAILANANLNRSDAIASFTVIIATIGNNMGFPKFDAIVAAGMAIFIFAIGLAGARQAVLALMDASMKAEQEQIRSLAQGVQGVESIGDVKARRIGRKILVELNVFLPAGLVLSRGLETSRAIRAVLRENMESVADVSVQLFSGEAGVMKEEKV